jgi:hypothetical protein
MGGHATYQGFHRVNANGAVDFQSDWPAVRRPCPSEVNGSLLCLQVHLGYRDDM